MAVTLTITLKIVLISLVVSVWIVAADELKRITGTRTLFTALAVMLARVLP